MKRKVIFLGLLLTFLAILSGMKLVAFVFAVLDAVTVQEGKISGLAATTLDVIWVPDNYTTIQAAIDAAHAGDTIMVRNGTYHENIKVNKTLELIGENFPVIRGRHLGFWGRPTVSILADNVTLTGFEIQHEVGRPEMDFGIDLMASKCNISGNIIRYNLEGITAGDNNFISNNTIEHNEGTGIGCSGPGNYISENVITNNGGGVFFPSPSNTLINNTIFNCEGGITLWANETIMRGNNMTGNDCHFYFDGGKKLNLYIQDIDESNTIDGKPMYYWINQHDKMIPSDAGYVALVNCTNVTVCGLDLKRNGHGVLMAFTENSTIYNCNMSNNIFGIFMWASCNNTIYHNNLVNNTFQVGNMESWYPLPTQLPPNTWDDTYPSGGNYWSNYADTDSYSGLYQNETESDGMGDKTRIIDTNNQDNFPLMAPISTFDVGVWNGTTYDVDVITNSTLSNFQLDTTQKTLSFNVTGEIGLGFCRVTIPNIIIQNMWQGNYTVRVNDNLWTFTNWTTTENTYIYFTYQHPQNKITITPEFPSAIILPLFMAITMVALIFHTLKAKKKNPF